MTTPEPAQHKRTRRMAREAQPATILPKAPSKLDQIAELLGRSGGASIPELVAATGWQQHSVRGAMAGTLKKRGLVISSDKIDGERRYRASAA
jgi:Protein of unknown function (DUF3489)